jgi:hypothetical protein
MHNPKFQLLQDDAVVSMKGKTVRTQNGIEIPADVVVFSTGFNVGNCEREHGMVLRWVNGSCTLRRLHAAERLVGRERGQLEDPHEHHERQDVPGYASTHTI